MLQATIHPYRDARPLLTRIMLGQSLPSITVQSSILLLTTFPKLIKWFLHKGEHKCPKTTGSISCKLKDIQLPCHVQNTIPNTPQIQCNLITTVAKEKTRLLNVIQHSMLWNALEKN